MVSVLVPVAGLALLIDELRRCDLATVAHELHPGYLLLALAWTAVSVAAAAYNLTGFSRVRVPFGRSLQVQLAVSGIRVVTPSVVSTPVIAIRFLTRSGARAADAVATVVTAQTAQLVATAGVVGGLAAATGVGGRAGAPLPSGPVAAAVGAGLGVLTVLTVLLTRHNRRVRDVVVGLWAQTRDAAIRMASYVHERPARAGGALLASGALTVSHVLAFGACVGAVGGHVPVLTLAGIYLGAAAVGSLLPTPGGVGAVEATLIAGLTAAGVPLPAATAATLLSRLIAVWLPALPGWLALVRLRRAQLL